MMKQITGSHLKKHNTTVKKYTEQYGLDSIYEPDVLLRAQQGGNLGGSNKNSIIAKKKEKTANINKYNQNPKLCKQCNNVIPYHKRQNTFCNNSCSATYANTHKTFGYRRSKIEKYIESELLKLYPCNKILFNDRLTLGSKELDIYIPELNIAFEINGIFHYRPIFGNDKLKSIQSSDEQKLHKCKELGIHLHIINVTEQHRFTPESSRMYIDEIVSTIGAINGSEPHLLSSHDRALH